MIESVTMRMAARMAYAIGHNPPALSGTAGERERIRAAAGAGGRWSRRPACDVRRLPALFAVLTIMARVTHLQTNFTAGELSPRLYGRVDIARYTNGAKRIENAYPLVHGGAIRRPGSRFITSQVKQ